MTTAPGPSAALTALPPVAKSFYTLCKKCDVDRYHIVLTHTSETSAKIECEVCHSKRSFSLPKAGASKAAKKPAGTAAGGRSPRKASHADEFNALMTKRSAEAGANFNIKVKFEMNQKISHPKFGPGFVKEVLPDRISVIFEDEVKTLIHNKA